jgi:hypothetical protein
MKAYPSHAARTLIPAFLRQKLLTGTVGEYHLSQLALLGLQRIQDEPELLNDRIAVYADMLLAAWEQRFSGNVTSLLDLDRMARILGPEQRTLLKGYNGALPPGIELDRDLIAQTDLPECMKLRLEGDWYRLHQDLAQAVGSYERSLAVTLLPETLYRLADAHALQGNRQKAVGALRRYVALRPWSVHGLLRLYDLAFERDISGTSPQGKGALLLYTWNHAARLDEMLRSLSKTTSPDFRPQIFALNNGSTDGTDAVLGRWKDVYGEQLTIIDLPVNIGAPAARNWLMELPEVKACDWAVYLDDDILLPPDWPGYFGASMEAYPEADVYGARFVSMDKPSEIQSADYHLFEPEMKQPSDEPYGQILISGLQGQLPDYGYFTFMRPCASVTGCVHLFRMKALQESGGFSLVFSPSQFDDFELDLRMDLKGKLPVYNGHLAIRHVRRSADGDAERLDRKRIALLRSHMAALESLYSPQDLETIRELDARVAEEDLHRKEAKLYNLFREKEG